LRICGFSPPVEYSNPWFFQEINSKFGGLFSNSFTFILITDLLSYYLP
jgi:hypothetical protein